MNCTDVCDAVIRKLKKAGYKIRDKEAHEDAVKALAGCTIHREAT